MSPKKKKNTGNTIRGSLPFALHCGYSNKKDGEGQMLIRLKLSGPTYTWSFNFERKLDICNLSKHTRTQNLSVCKYSWLLKKLCEQKWCRQEIRTYASWLYLAHKMPVYYFCPVLCCSLEGWLLSISCAPPVMTSGPGLGYHWQLSVQLCLLLGPQLLWVDVRYWEYHYWLGVFAQNSFLNPHNSSTKKS